MLSNASSTSRLKFNGQRSRAACASHSPGSLVCLRVGRGVAPAIVFSGVAQSVAVSEWLARHSLPGATVRLAALAGNLNAEPASASGSESSRRAGPLAIEYMIVNSTRSRGLGDSDSESTLGGGRRERLGELARRCHGTQATTTSTTVCTCSISTTA